jgi:hypothetical protein
MIISDHFMSVGAQVAYGIIVLGVTIMNLLLNRSVKDTTLQSNLLTLDIIIKFIALGLTWIYPPTMLIVTLGTALLWIINGILA